MANATIEYLIQILKSGDGAQQAAKDLKDVDAAAGKSTASMASLTKEFKQFFAALGGVALLREALNAFTNQANALARLREVSGATADQMEQLHDSAEQLSQLMGRDLNRAVMALGQALRGDVDQFKAMGFAINDALSPTQQFNNILDEIRKRFESRELSDPIVADVERAKKALEDLKVAFGGVLAAGINAVTGLGADIGRAMGGAGGQQMQRENLLNAIQRQVQRGTLGPIQGDALRAQLNAAFATESGQRFGIPGNIPARSQDERQAILDSIFSQIGGGRERSPGGEATPVNTPSLRAADLRQAQAMLEEITQQMNRAEAMRMQAIEERERLSDQASLREVANAQRTAEETRKLQNELVLSQLTGEAKVKAQMEIDHQERLANIRERQFETEEDYARQIDLENQRHANEVKNYNEAKSLRGQLRADLKNIAATGQQAFSEGLAGAIVDAFRSGDKAFQQFASNFLRLISQMILQALILRAIQGIAGAFGGSGGGTSGGQIGIGRGMLGGQWARLALGGMAELNQSTVFPRFNVMAGEAGREMMTVLARPRLMNLGGITAQVGDVGTNRLAITNADALARGRGGAGGSVDIAIHLEQGLRADIVQESVANARVRIVQDMTQDTPLSRSTRRLAT